MLEGCADADIAICVTVHEQELDLPHGAGEDCRGGGVVNRLVSSDDTIVGGGVWRVLVPVVEELLLVLIDLASVKPGGVHIGNGIVDI